MIRITVEGDRASDSVILELNGPHHVITGADTVSDTKLTPVDGEVSFEITTQDALFLARRLLEELESFEGLGRS